jgi:hypothetical protein
MPLFSRLLHHPVHAGGANLLPMLAATGLDGGGVTLGADVISANLHLLPPRAFPVIALYLTQAGGGSGYIAATRAQLAEYPNCVTIAQLPAGDPFWADAIDFEAGAAAPAEIPVWAKGALASYEKGLLPWQRMPAVYCSASSVHVVADALVNGGVTSGVGLWLANWNLTEPQAAADVIARSGPFPVIGVQFSDPGDFDLDIWSTAWLDARSGAPQPAGYGPPLNLRVVNAGPDSVKLAWQPPGTPGLPDPADYEIFMYRGQACTRSTIAPTYNPFRNAGAVTEWQGGSLERGRTYTCHVAAAGDKGSLVRSHTYASVTFTTRLSP